MIMSKIDNKMQTFHKYAELRKEFQETCETRIGFDKDQYIKYLETHVLAYCEKFGGIDITPKGLKNGNRI